MDDGCLGGFVVIAWSVVVVATWRRVSLFPLFAVSTVLMVIGYLLNAWIAWSGTAAIVVVHVVGAAVAHIRNTGASENGT